MNDNLVLDEGFRLSLIGDAADSYVIKIVHVKDASIVIEDGVASIEVGEKTILFASAMLSGLVPVGAILGESDPIQIVTFSNSLEDLEKKLREFFLEKMRASIDNAIKLMAGDEEAMRTLEEINDRFDELSSQSADNLIDEIFSHTRAELAYHDSLTASRNAAAQREQARQDEPVGAGA